MVLARGSVGVGGRLTTTGGGGVKGRTDGLGNEVWGEGLGAAGGDVVDGRASESERLG